jgi:hypothetical protein
MYLAMVKPLLIMLGKVPASPLGQARWYIICRNCDYCKLMQISLTHKI